MTAYYEACHFAIPERDFEEMRENTMSGNYELYVGVDISAKTFTATWGSSFHKAEKPKHFPQTPSGYARFQEALATYGIAPQKTLIGLEASGSYWIHLAVVMHQAGYSVSVLNPGQVANFARSLPQRGKTDTLDAQVILRFTVERDLHIWSPPNQIYHELRQRLQVRDKLLDMRTQMKNQRHALQQWPVQIPEAQASLEAVLTELNTQLRVLEKEIAQILKQGEWAQSAKLLLATPSIGLVTAAWMLVGTMNFTIGNSAEQLTAYAGLVPREHQSGTSVHKRPKIGHTGNKRLRTALYMASISAVRCNPTLKAFYERLKKANKPKKLALCAVARKLLILARAIVKTGKAYTPPIEDIPEATSA